MKSFQQSELERSEWQNHLLEDILSQLILQTELLAEIRDAVERIPSD